MQKFNLVVFAHLRRRKRFLDESTYASLQKRFASLKLKFNLAAGDRDSLLDLVRLKEFILTVGRRF